jgi:cytochrome c-type biogenesis protein CcmH/NrfF
MSETDWTDRNAHDPGVTLLQLFLWLSTALMVVIGVIVLRRLIARPFPSGHDREGDT